MPNSEQKKQQWNKRLSIVKCIYNLIILDFKDINILEIQNTYNFDADSLKIVEFVMSNHEKLKNKISNFISNDWSFDRINIVEKAILFQTLSESLILKTEKNILIDQAIITSKNFCDEESYKFINGILDKIL